MRLKIKFFSKMIMIVSFIIVFLFLLNIETFATVSNNQNDLIEEKVYCDVSIDEDFDGSCVLVVMKHSVSAVNKVFEEAQNIDTKIKTVLKTARNMKYIDKTIVVASILFGGKKSKYPK